jgi:hypothetical protein
MSFILDVTAVTSFGIMTGLEDSVIGRSTGPTSSLEAVFRSTSNNYGIASHDGTTWDIDVRTGPSTAPGTFFVVMKLDMDAEILTLWLNPADLTDVENTATHTISGSPASTWLDMTHFIFSLGGDEAGTIDEIRIGTTIQTVTPLCGPVTTAPGMIDIVVATGVDPQISFMTETCGTYQLQKSPDLSPESWTDVAGQSVSGDGTQKTLSDRGCCLPLI